MSVVTQLNFISTLENSDNNNNNNNNTCILRLSTSRSEEVNNNDNINNIEEDETAEIYINENEINDEVVEFISGSAWLLPQLFTEEEVEEIRETAQQHHSSVQHGLSYCYKACFDSEELSERISQRIQSALDSHSATLNKSKDDSKERLKIEKLIKQLRFITYPIGGYIGPHTDGIRVCPDTLQFSNLTLILYLQTSNTGETKFLRGDKENYSEWYSVIPRKGSVLIFNHNLLHMGVGVGHEGKVLLRGDIVAKGLAPSPTI